MSKDSITTYTDPITGKVYELSEDELLHPNSHSLKGTPRGAMSEETKQKISASLVTSHEETPRTHLDKTKHKISKSLTGHTVSDETKKKMSESAKKRWKTRKQEGHIVSQKTKTAISKATKGKPKSAEHKAKISAAMKAKHAKR